MKVKDIMTKEINSISPDISGWEGLMRLSKNKISGLPVIEPGGKLVGMFTEKDVLSFILPSYVEKVGSFIYEENPKGIKKKLSELDKVKVNQLMRKDVITISEDVTLCEAARVMLTQKARRLPVLDKTGKVAGIIAREDVLKAFIQETEAAK
ncbi:MAG: CBS domain-containing protein [Candidatus Omnitrophota bacterium]|nr:CBS domain-containing protein [Candidatus Omnitrophota bacterium]